MDTRLTSATFRFSEASLCVFDRSCCLNFSVAFFQFWKPFETNASSAQRASSVSFSREASVQVWQSTPPMLWSKWSHGKSLNHCCWNFNFRFGSIWTGIQLTSWGWKGWSGKLGRVLAHAPFSAIFSFESSTSFWELDCSRRVVGDCDLMLSRKTFWYPYPPWNEKEITFQLNKFWHVNYKGYFCITGHF